MGAADIVVAPATPWGHSALAVVRFSGSDLFGPLDSIVDPMGEGPLPAGRARRVWLRDGEGRFDDAIAVRADPGRSYTGEETLEISCHGNPLVVQRLLDAAIAVGCRLAEPGEFTKRAVVNGKLDLVAAEAVDQACRATSPAGLEIARSGLDGGLQEWLAQVRQQLVAATSELEARLDWPSDELAEMPDAALLADLSRLAEACREVAETARSGRVQIDGARVALVGVVNAGKSSLFNRLLGRERALVHPTPGTTRDVVEATTQFNGLSLTLLDTAGERQTDDPVEAAGLALGAQLVADADLLVVVLRCRPQGPTDTELDILRRTSDRLRLVVCNGVDTPGVVPADALPVSAFTGSGLPQVKGALLDALVSQTHRSAALRIGSARQADWLLTVARAAEEAVEALPIAGVAVSADALTRGVEALDSLTGADTREDVLDQVFGRFCIGK
jgi:tRNA modification GTPase